jgi:hypothetical protein
VINTASTTTSRRALLSLELVVLLTCARHFATRYPWLTRQA